MRTVRMIDGKPEDSRYVSASAYEHYLQARVALGRGELQAADDELREALILDPDSPLLHTELARIQAHLGQLKQAHSQLRRALELRPGFPDALVLQGQLFRKEDKLEAAERSFRDCIRYNPGHAPAYLKLAAMLEAADHPNRASKVLLRMVKRVGKEYRTAAHSRLGLLCLRRVKYHCAARHLGLALQGESDLGTLLKLAHVQRALGHDDQAIKLLREAFDRSGGNQQVAAQLLQMLHHRSATQQVRDLLGVLATAAAEDPAQVRGVAELALTVKQDAWALQLVETQRKRAPSPQLEVTRGTALYRVGKTEEARATLTALIDGPAGPLAALRLARLLGKEGQYPEAARVLQQALTRHGHDTSLVLARSRALFEAGRAEESVRVVRTALAGHPDDRTLRFGLAAALERTGAWRDAIKEIEQILRRHPRDAPALNFLGYTLADRGKQLDRADRAIRRALFLHPGEGYILDSLGWLHYRRREWAEAQRLLQMAVRLDPEEAEILGHLAEVEVALHRIARGMQLLRRALTLSEDGRLTSKLRLRLEQLEKGRVGKR